MLSVSDSLLAIKIMSSGDVGFIRNAKAEKQIHGEIFRCTTIIRKLPLISATLDAKDIKPIFMASSSNFTWLYYMWAIFWALNSVSLSQDWILC